MTQPRRSTYTPKNISSASVAAEIRAYNALWVLSCPSQIITHYVSANSLHCVDPNFSTQCNVGSINLLHCTAMYWVKWNSAISPTLKHNIRQPVWCAEGVIAHRHLEAELLRNLHSQANDLSAASAKHSCQLTKASEITFEEVVLLREEGEHEDAQLTPRLEARTMKHTSTASKKIECFSDTRHSEKLCKLV